MWEGLLKCIYEYYPIGAFRKRENYSGYNKMATLVEQKIHNEATDPKAPGNVFHLELQKAFPGFIMMDFNHLMFPSYISVFELGANKTGNKKDSCWLYVCVSLLCEYYTLFVTHTYAVYDCVDEIENKKFESFIGFNVVSFDRKYCPYPYPDIELMKSIIKKRFPTKTFISHNTLHNQTVTGGIPYGLEQDEYHTNESYTFLDYLFLNNFAGDNNVRFDY